MTNGIGRVGWRNFVSATPTTSYLLDNYGGASTAYSLRKLSSTYTGSAIRVRRSSDNTEQNIGFDASGNLDTTTLLSFVGSGDGFVTTWYDQSGNVNNMMQANANQQPKIVLSGVVNTTNSKPSIRFQNSGLYNTQPTFSAPISIFSVINNNSTSGGNYFIYSNANTSETYGSTIGLVNNGWRIQSAGGGATLYGLNNGQIFGSKVISTIMASNSAWDLFLNNTESFNGSISGGTFTLNALGYRSNPGGVFYSDYDLRETIIYPSDKRSSRSGINSNINTYYSLYSTYTTRTSAFAAATGITDTTILNALNTFDTGLISNGLDTKMKALYPFVGGTANTHKYNFMDARDADAAFRLQFNGGWIHSSTGAKPNGTNAYADSYWVPFTQSAIDNVSYNYYSRTNTSGASNFGACDSGYANVSNMYISFNGTQNYSKLNGMGYLITSSANSRGLFGSNTTTNGTFTTWKNGSKLGTNTSTPTGLSQVKLWIGAGNFIGAPEYGNMECAFFNMSTGLTDVQQATFYNLVQAMQTSLSRQV